MPLYTEEALRHLLGPPREGMKLSLPRGSRFSPAAQDFLNHWKVAIAFDDPSGSLPSGEKEASGMADSGWDRPGEFPVVLSGDAPRCALCGSGVKEKPEHMTQVDAERFDAKNSPRIRFRGKMDSLNAWVMLTASRARTAGYPKLVEHLATVAAYCREIMSAEYNLRPVAPIQVAGFDEAALRKATHDPQKELGVPHLAPAVEDAELLHWLNVLRTQVRETELVALDAFPPGSSRELPELAVAVNRLSSAVYLLELLLVRGDYGAGGLL
ncbi:ethanolamine utilization cobalamin adenosyltransferase [Alkalispirochaeta americana]|uniref:Ethanolamine utilization cobalamin adenosyltransferase n=2 Tax=Alkalispirochaeta americana TaxID=159291 RepID=A0A1N6TZ13_9SPIO|nr:ethanolamine utilization cobalamin adenosyltransferase [Alkalispirochaeta americana]